MSHTAVTTPDTLRLLLARTTPGPQRSRAESRQLLLARDYSWPVTPALSGQRRNGAPNHDGVMVWAQRHCEQRRSCVGVGVCVFASVSMCARACMHACVRDGFAIYNNDILPMLIMIIMNIIILYFIQIRHPDDFPSTSRPTGLV